MKPKVITIAFNLPKALQQTFQSIDNLESLVTRVKTDLNKIEAAVDQAEVDLGPTHGFTTVIRPLFFVSLY